MMGSDFPPVAELLPHRGAAVLVDAVLEDTEDAIRVRARISRGNPYFVEGRGVPAWVGIELMAQAAAAHAGLAARRLHRTPNKGMLLGTRRYEAATAYFPEGAELEIRARREFGGEGDINACACEILSEGRTLVTATIVLVEVREGAMP